MGDVLPSLFRWEPGMQPEGLGAIITGVTNTSEGVVLWFAGEHGEEAEPAEPYRPDMSHAGTRGLVLEQVRAALGEPTAYLRPKYMTDGGCHLWRFAAVNLPDGNIFHTEGAALLDAFHRICEAIS